MKKGKYVRGTILEDSPTLQTTVADFQSPLAQENKGFVNFWLPIILIVILTGWVYSFSLDNDTTNWDDDKYTDNTLVKNLDAETVGLIFASDDLKEERYFMGNYHPLTMLSLNLDYQRSEMKPNGKPYPIVFIINNIIIHLLACFMVYLVFAQLFHKRIYPIIIALIFGIHTLHVESVTWISERKDVLYTMFYFLSLYLYILYKKRLNVMFYILSLIVFVISALSKGQAVSLAITLFLVDYLISEDYLNWRKHLNKIPFLLLALVFGIISMKAQATSTALSETDQYEWYQRLAFGSNGFFQYIWRFVLPINLSNLYPYPDIINRTVPALYWLCVPLFIGIVALNLFIFRRSKVITFGLMFFIVNIALLLQFIPVGSAMYSDRYAYIPSVGLSVLLAYLMDLLVEKYQSKRNVFYIIFSIYTLLLCYLTIQREKIWHDSGTLWSDCVSKYPEAVIGWNNLGSYNNLLADSIYKKTDDSKFIEYKNKAIDCFSNGIKYKPDYVHSFYNRGLAYMDLFKTTNDTAYLTKALNDYNSAISFDLNFAPAFQNRAIVYDCKVDQFLSTGNRDSVLYYTSMAISDYNRAFDVDPTMYEIFINRGTSYGKMGDFRSAITDFEQYDAIRPDNASLYSNMGLAYSGLKLYDEAISYFSRSIDLDSTFEGSFFNRSLTYRQLGDSLRDVKYYGLAVKDVSRCIALSPQKSQYHFMRAVYYQLMGNRVGACEDFHQAYNLGYQAADYYIKNYCNGR